MFELLAKVLFAFSDANPAMRIARQAARDTGRSFDNLWESTVGHTAANGNNVRRSRGLFGTVTTVTGECWSCGGSGRVRGQPCRRCGGTGEYRREFRG